MPSDAPARRPAGVTLLMVLIVISGIFSVAAGIFFVVTNDNADVLRETKESSDTLLTLGIASIVIGVIYLLVARGLATGGGFSRFLVGLISVINLAGGIWLVATKDGQLQTQGIVNIAIATIVLILLYSPKANAFFRTN